jgi:hypothetical protein
MSKDDKKKVEEVEIKKPKANKPVLPATYADGPINMAASMITTKAAFIKIWKGSKAAIGLDLDKAYNRAKSWKDKHR